MSFRRTPVVISSAVRTLLASAGLTVEKSYPLAPLKFSPASADTNSELFQELICLAQQCGSQVCFLTVTHGAQPYYRS